MNKFVIAQRCCVSRPVLMLWSASQHSRCSYQCFFVNDETKMALGKDKLIFIDDDDKNPQFSSKW